MPLMHARTRGGGFDGLLEEPHGCGAEEGQERGPAEDVHVGHQGGLLLHHAGEQPHGTGAGLGTAEVLTEVAGDSGRTLLQDEVGRAEVGADLGLARRPREMTLQHPPFTSQTPPTFLLQAEDDHVDNVNDSLAYYIALKNAGAPVEMHLYAEGEHAFGLRRTKFPITGWPQLVETWLGTIGMISE